MSLDDPEDNPPLEEAKSVLAGVRLLIVDDDALGRKALARVAALLGASAVTTGSIAKAREVLNDGTEFDCAVIDLLLLNGNGAQLVKELRVTRPYLATLLISGVDFDALGMNTGEFATLEKPISIDSFARAVIDAIGRMQTEPPPTEPDHERV